MSNFIAYWQSYPSISPTGWIPLSYPRGTELPGWIAASCTLLFFLLLVEYLGIQAINKLLSWTAPIKPLSEEPS